MTPRIGMSRDHAPRIEPGDAISSVQIRPLERYGGGSKPSVGSVSSVSGLLDLALTFEAVLENAPHSRGGSRTDDPLELLDGHGLVLDPVRDTENGTAGGERFREPESEPSPRFGGARSATASFAHSSIRRRRPSKRAATPSAGACGCDSRPTKTSPRSTWRLSTMAHLQPCPLDQGRLAHGRATRSALSGILQRSAFRGERRSPDSPAASESATPHSLNGSDGGWRRRSNERCWRTTDPTDSTSGSSLGDRQYAVVGRDLGCTRRQFELELPVVHHDQHPVVDDVD